MKSLLKLAAAAVGLLIILLAIAAIKTPAQAPVRDALTSSNVPTVDADAVGAHLATALTFPTESSFANKEGGSPEFEGFISWVRETYPLVHQHLHLERVNNYSMLFTWQGTNADARPILLAGHHDVVPGGSAEDRATWAHPPFDGVIEDGVIYGRGALDDKPNVVGLLEATEHLLAKGFQPSRTIYLAFGHDEEVGGPRGAKAMADLLEERGISLEFVLDEGGAVVDGESMGIGVPVALVGTAEKGSVSVNLSVDNEGPTHSSMPMMQTPVGILSRAIIKLENNQMPARITPVVKELQQSLALELDFATRMALYNQWLFEPLIIRNMEKSPRNNSMIRTTTAPTMIKGSMKENVLPIKARAVVNFRILPGDTIEDVIAHVHRVIDDPRVKIEPFGGREASPVSSTDSAAFPLIKATNEEIFGSVVTYPYLVMGGTDARHYVNVSDNQFRFSPMRLRGDQLASAHGLNERNTVADFANSVRWYIRFIENLENAD